jgi:hypothetical protein
MGTFAGSSNDAALAVSVLAAVGACVAGAVVGACVAGAVVGACVAGAVVGACVAALLHADATMAATARVAITRPLPLNEIDIVLLLLKC